MSAPIQIQLGAYACTLRDIVPADRAAVLALHQRVFGGTPDAAWFDWKYGPLPSQGRGQAVGAWMDGALVAFCAGIPRQILHQGVPVAGLQIGDVMVHPDWRGLFTRHGPFFHVSKTLYDSRLGPLTERDFQLGFGFPSGRHLKLATLLGLLHDKGTMETLHWDLPQDQAFHLPWTWQWRMLHPHAPEFDACVNQAWRVMQKDTQELTVGQRDAAYVRWRFVDRPSSAYQFFTLRRRWPDSKLGVAVLDMRNPLAHWLDWVGPLEWMPIAAHACRAQARLHGGTELMAWASQAVAKVLKRTGVARSAECAGIGMPVRSMPGVYGATQTANLHWWFMGGDTDFL